MEFSSSDNLPKYATSIHVGRARSGNPDSLEWLVKRFSPLLLGNADYRLGKTLRELYDPEDIVNDVWLGVLPKLPELPSREGRHTPVLLKYLSKTLVYRINNLIEKHIRGKPRKQQAGEDTLGARKDPVASLPAETTNVVQQLVRQELHDTVTACLEQLDPKDREIIVLRGIEQRPYKEISLHLGSDRKILAVQYQRALEKLRKELPGSIFDELTDD